MELSEMRAVALAVVQEDDAKDERERYSPQELVDAILDVIGAKHFAQSPGLCGDCASHLLGVCYGGDTEVLRDDNAPACGYFVRVF